LIALRKASELEKIHAHEGEERKSVGSGTSVDMASSDPKEILRLRIAARKQGSDTDLSKRRASSPRLGQEPQDEVTKNATPPRGRASSRAKKT
jgi:hypothetical protein